jgi:peptidoglycan hydrolase CwlO-like protein
MANLNSLEARVAAATQSLAGRHGQAQELQGKVLQVEEELTRSRADCGRLQSELAQCHEDKSKLEARLEQVAGENRRLINEAVRNREELSRLEAEEAGLCQQRDRLVALLDSLMQAIESHGVGERNTDQSASAKRALRAGSIETVPPLGPVSPLPMADGDGNQPGWLALGSAKPQPTNNGSDGDIPNEAARRLMDRIRDRIEAHQRA